MWAIYRVMSRTSSSRTCLASTALVKFNLRENMLSLNTRTLVMLRRRKRSTKIEIWEDYRSISSGKMERKEVVKGMNNQGKGVRMSCVSTATKRATTHGTAKAGEDLGPGIEIEEEGVDLPETAGTDDKDPGAGTGPEEDPMIDTTRGQRAATLVGEETIGIAEIEEIVMIDETADHTEKMETGIEGTIATGEIEITGVIETIDVMTEEMAEGMKRGMIGAIEDATRGMIIEGVGLMTEMLIDEEGMIVGRTRIVNRLEVETTIEKRSESKCQRIEGQREGLIGDLKGARKGDQRVLKVTSIDRKMMTITTGKIQLILEMKSLWNDNRISNRNQGMEITIIKMMAINKNLIQRSNLLVTERMSKEMRNCLNEVKSMIEIFNQLILYV